MSRPPSGVAHCVVELTKVAHALAFGCEVADVLVVRFDHDRLASGDLEVITSKAAELRRIVGHQLHRLHAQINQDLRPNAVFSAVDRQAQFGVGIDRIEPTILQLIGP